MKRFISVTSALALFLAASVPVNAPIQAADDGAGFKMYFKVPFGGSESEKSLSDRAKLGFQVDYERANEDHFGVRDVDDYNLMDMSFGLNGQVKEAEVLGFDAKTAHELITGGPVLQQNGPSTQDAGVIGFLFENPALMVVAALLSALVIIESGEEEENRTTTVE